MPPGGMGLDRSRQSALGFAGFEPEGPVSLEEEDDGEDEKRTERGREREERAAIAGDIDAIAVAVVIFGGEAFVQ